MASKKAEIKCSRIFYDENSDNEDPILTGRRAYEISQYAKNMTHDLGYEIQKIRKAKGFSQLELSEKALLNEKTVRRIENGETNNVKIGTLISICVALELCPYISRQLLFNNGYSLTPNSKLNVLYALIIDEYFKYGIYRCNELLKTNGFAGLSRKEE